MSNISRDNNGSADHDSFSKEPGNSQSLLVIINCFLNVPLVFVSLW